MGYNLYVTRAVDWSSNSGNEISPQEWLSVVDGDPSLVRFSANGPYFALWDRADQPDSPWIDWFGGNLYSKNPDRAVLGKLLEIANRLHARVQGEEGEEYRSPEDIGAD